MISSSAFLSLPYRIVGLRCMGWGDSVMLELLISVMKCLKKDAGPCGISAWFLWGIGWWVEVL